MVSRVPLRLAVSGLMSWRACRLRDGAVMLIGAGWYRKDGLFGRSASAGLGIGRDAGLGWKAVATHSGIAGRSTRGRLDIS